MKMRILSLLVLLVIPSVTYGGEQKDAKSDDSYQTYLEFYQTAHNQIINELNKTKERIQEIANYTKKYNELSLKINAINNKQKRKKNNVAVNPTEQPSNDQQKLYEEFKRDFSILSSVNLFDLNSKKSYVTYITEPNKISDLIDEQINIYKKSGTETCFSNKSYVKTKECEIFKNYCSDIWGYGIEDGKFYYKELNVDYEITKVPIDLENDNRYDLNSDVGLLNGPPIRNRDSQLFCKLLSFTSVPLKPKFVGHHYDPFRKLPYIIYADPKNIDVSCIEVKPTEKAVGNLRNYRRTYPEDYLAEFAIDSYDRWEKTCHREVKNLCNNTFTVKDRIILSYPTVGCEIRDVTAEDIKNDMQYFNAEAERLKHSTLLDLIEVCQKASKAGYYWLYIKPVLGNECKDKKRKKEVRE